MTHHKFITTLYSSKFPVGYIFAQWFNLFTALTTPIFQPCSFSFFVSYSLPLVYFLHLQLFTPFILFSTISYGCFFSSNPRKTSTFSLLSFYVLLISLFNQHNECKWQMKEIDWLCYYGGSFGSFRLVVLSWFATSQKTTIFCVTGQTDLKFLITYATFDHAL